MALPKGTAKQKSQYTYTLLICSYSYSQLPLTAQVFQGVSKTLEKAQNLLSAMPIHNYRKSQPMSLLL